MTTGAGRSACGWLKTRDLPAALAQVESIFNKYNPAYPFEYRFADVEFQKKYTTINLTVQLANLFAALALFITGLGLFGLASLHCRAAQQGDRHPQGAGRLGAEHRHVDVERLFKAGGHRLHHCHSAGLVGLAHLLGTLSPIRTDIYWWIFPLTGIIALVFALVFVVGQALRAAQSDPVKALRSE